MQISIYWANWSSPIEAAGKSGDLETIRREVPGLEQGFLQLKAAMERVLF